MPSRPAFMYGVWKVSDLGSRLMTWIAPRIKSTMVPIPPLGSGNLKLVFSSRRNALSSGRWISARLDSRTCTVSPVHTMSPRLTGIQSPVLCLKTSTEPSTETRSACQSSQLRSACAEGAANVTAAAQAATCRPCRERRWKRFCGVFGRRAAIEDLFVVKSAWVGVRPSTSPRYVLPKLRKAKDQSKYGEVRVKRGPGQRWA